MQSGSGLAIRFNLQPVKDEEASVSAGRPVFRDVEYIKIIVPGDRNSEVHRPVRDSDRQQYAAQYDAWKRGADEKVQGVPLDEWPGATRSQVETLRFFHVRTVEEMASVSDQNLSKLGMGYETLRQRARDYIATAQGMAPLESLRAQHEELKSHHAMAMQRLEAMNKELEAIKAGAASNQELPLAKAKQRG